MMKPKIGILFLAFVLLVIGCTENWDEHYNKQPETINTNVWEAIKGKSELSRFVELMVKYKYDTLFQNTDTYTIFVPDNAAFDKFVQSQISDTTILNYHITQHFVQPVDIQGKRKLQTLAEKYSTFDRVDGKPLYDGISLKYESPLYINGKFFIMGEVALPRLNLYEYFTLNNPILKRYIDKQDTVILDMEKSRPIGFNDEGKTVYDSVSTTINRFDEAYFPVATEWRAWAVTIVYPRQATYENGLTVMAGKLGGNFQDYTDIPEKWQEEILVPHLIKHGIFLNMLEVSEFKPIRIKFGRPQFNMMNIRGDSVIVDYVPRDPYLCSNGITYDYTNFVVPDSLFSGVQKFEGEWLARPTGFNRYEWRKNVTVTNTPFAVVNQFATSAVDTIPSNDSIMVVNFTKGYKGTYNLEFNVRNMFPRKYRVVVNTHMDIGGIYDIFVNDVPVRTFNYDDYITYRGLIKSVNGKNTFTPVGRYNRFDFYVENIVDYGRPKIRFEYKGPGTRTPGNGLAIDVIEFIPAD